MVARRGSGCASNRESGLVQASRCSFLHGAAIAVASFDKLRSNRWRRPT